MKNNRRKFLKQTSLAGMSVAGAGIWQAFVSESDKHNQSGPVFSHTAPVVGSAHSNEDTLSIIGLYGPSGSFHKMY